MFFGIYDSIKDYVLLYLRGYRIVHVNDDKNNAKVETETSTKTTKDETSTKEIDTST